MPQAALNFKPNLPTSTPGVGASGRMAALAGMLLLVGIAVWSFFPTLIELSDKWMNDPGYSHGVLVPLFAIYLLWARREQFAVGSPAWLPAAGCFVIVVACRIASGVFIFTWVDAVALLPCLFGAALLVGGRATLKWCWPAIAFLFFMIPLPYSVERALGAPLQKVATVSSTFLLQAFGQPAVAEGNTIMLNDVELKVVEACSGLRMLVTFFAFSTGVALMIRKPLLEKFCIILSAVPIALITNILRITATGVMYQTNEKFAKTFFHDLAGWVMMPICLVFLGVELWILNRLIVQTQSTARPMLMRGSAI